MHILGARERKDGDVGSAGLYKSGESDAVDFTKDTQHSHVSLKLFIQEYCSRKLNLTIFFFFFLKGASDIFSSL